jgi:parallel beta-helix repeat protein
VKKTQENCVFSNNYLNNSGYEGIQLWDTSDCIISNNSISNHSTGIFIHHSTKVNISGCEVSDNYRYGIAIGKSDSCFVTDNNITNNDVGINIDYESNNNNIYYNNLINNEKNVYDECDNTWDDGKYGNYWSDYEEKYPNAKPKLFKPWMWNTPYEITGGDNKDNCPLIKQWPNSASIDMPRDKALNNPFLNWLQSHPILFPLL